MTDHLPPHRLLLALSMLVLVGASACTSPPPPPTGDQALSSALGARGVEVTAPDCDRTGPVQVGDVTRCTVDVDGQQLDVTARITGIEDDGSPTVDLVSTGRPLPRVELSKRISEDAERPVTCDADLAPQPVATATCTIDGGGPVVVTADDVTPDGVIHYSYR